MHILRTDARHLPLADASVDAIVTDPPYELGFMGRDWDDSGVAFDPATWAEALRVAKPGAHLLAFGAPRTYPELAVAIRQAGWERRDTLMWLYGSGFPKSLDVSKAIDKRPGVTLHTEFARHLAERREATGLSRADVSEAVVGTRSGACWNWEHHQFPEAKWWPALADLLALDPTWEAVIMDAEREKVGERDANLLAVAPGQGSDRSATSLYVTAPATDEARRWEGWGTALKPAYEPIVLARKPLIGTVAANVLAHGTGGLNIDGTRIGTGDGGGREGEATAQSRYGDNGIGFQPTPGPRGGDARGRWPANLLLDEEAAALLDESTGNAGAGGRASGPTLSGVTGRGLAFGARNGTDEPAPFYDDSGGPSRFFYTSKADYGEREAGLLGHLPCIRCGGLDTTEHETERGVAPCRRNPHPTVKPVDLMRWLLTLVTPPGGTVLDPFLGSGTTGVAAGTLGFPFIGADLDEHYLMIARLRMAAERPMMLAL